MTTTAKNDLSKTYNSFKEFQGKQYIGMQFGGAHHWDYDQGDWKETRIPKSLGN